MGMENYAKIVVLPKLAPAMYFCHNVLHLMPETKASESELDVAFTILIVLIPFRLYIQWTKS